MDSFSIIYYDESCMIVGHNRWDFSAQLERFGPSATSQPRSLDECYAYCQWVARTHYENFQIASFLIPRPLRQHFHNIYAYCRWSDDLADEAGSTTRATELLGWWRQQLDRLFAGQPVTHPVMQALAPTIAEFSLPQQPFADLLSAFEQDQTKFRYDSMRELRDYCKRSANPVGRLVLGLARAADDEESLRLSDEICTGLQLANFCQDMRRDAAIGRIYAPRELWQKHEVDEAIILRAQVTPELRRMLNEFVTHAQVCFNTGIALAVRVPRWLRVDVRLFQAGGVAILKEIQRANYDVWTRRPAVSKWRKVRLLLRELIRK